MAQGRPSFMACALDFAVPAQGGSYVTQAGRAANSPRSGGGGAEGFNQKKRRVGGRIAVAGVWRKEKENRRMQVRMLGFFQEMDKSMEKHHKQIVSL